MDLTSDLSARIAGIGLIALSIGSIAADVDTILTGVDPKIGAALAGAALAVGMVMVLDGWGIVARGSARLRTALSRRST